MKVALWGFVLGLGVSAFLGLLILTIFAGSDFKYLFKNKGVPRVNTEQEINADEIFKDDNKSRVSSGVKTEKGVFNTSTPLKYKTGSDDAPHTMSSEGKMRFPVFTWWRKTVLESDGDRIYFKGEPVEHVRNAGKFKNILLKGIVAIFKGNDALWALNMDAWSRAGFPDAPKKILAARIDGADPETFRAVPGTPFEAPVYFIDKEHVYHGACVLPGLDPESFGVINWMNGTVQDKGGIYKERFEDPASEIVHGELVCNVNLEKVPMNKLNALKSSLFDMVFVLPKAWWLDIYENGAKIRPPSILENKSLHDMRIEIVDSRGLLKFYNENDTGISSGYFSAGFKWQKTITVSNKYKNKIRAVYYRPYTYADGKFVVLEVDNLKDLNELPFYENIVQSMKKIKG